MEKKKRLKYKIVEQGGEQIVLKKSSAIAYYDEDGNAVMKKRPPESNILTKRDRGDKILFTVMMVVLAVQCISLFLPILWVIISSFKEKNEFLFPTSIISFPARWEFENYIEVFSLIEAEGTTFMGMLFNSVWYTVLSTALRVFCPAVTAYVISKYQFVGKNFLYAMTVTILTIPIVGMGGSMLRLVGDLGVYDSPMYVVLTAMSGFTGNFLVYYGFFKSVSWSYAEAAQMDGANPFVVFFKIMLPQAAPIMLTYAITMGISHWTDYSTMLLFLPSWPTIASGLYVASTAIERYSGGDTPVYYAGLILSLIPTVVVFALFSNKIMTSISIGGLKG